MTTLQKVALSVPTLYKQFKDKICNNGRFCEDMLTLGLCVAVFYIMALSVAQITV